MGLRFQSREGHKVRKDLEWRRYARTCPRRETREKVGSDHLGPRRRHEKDASDHLGPRRRPSCPIGHVMEEVASKLPEVRCQGSWLGPPWSEEKPRRLVQGGTWHARGECHVRGEKCMSYHHARSTHQKYVLPPCISYHHA